MSNYRKHYRRNSIIYVSVFYLKLGRSRSRSRENSRERYRPSYGSRDKHSSEKSIKLHVSRIPKSLSERDIADEF